MIKHPIQVKRAHPSCHYLRTGILRHPDEIVYTAHSLLEAVPDDFLQDVPGEYITIFYILFAQLQECGLDVIGQDRSYRAANGCQGESKGYVSHEHGKL